MKIIPKHIIETLNKDGIYICKGFLHKVTAEEIKKEAKLAILNEEKYDYSFGDAVKLYGKCPQYPLINGLFDCELFNAIADGWYDMPNKYESSIITHEYKSDNMASNSFLHADKNHALSVFLYLNDVDEDCGPFSYVPGSVGYGSRLRMSGYKNQLKQHKDLLYLKENVVDVIGPAGTLVIFSTDVIHMGGCVNNGERWAIRGHWRP